ncbi:complex I NDUFA9 subunit family protein [Sphingomonas sp.]|uniref:complex I NDUFA9 subunit family protein n=1 Tax=Sphingomonas sp. TaxID=28214 RepID=UPI003B0063C3
MTELVTLFGGGGFVGRYVVQALLRRGRRVRVVGRDPRRAFFLKPQGGLGQIQFVAADVTRPRSVERAVAGSDAVVNLVGVLFGRFEAIHVEGARNVAEAARAAGAQAFVHVSAIGADPGSPSAYGRSKAAGEAAVRDAFDGAAILRPSVVFGPEDDFVNRFARLIRLAPIVPVLGGGARFQPVYVSDVAQAAALAATEPQRFAGRTFELGGPEIVTMAGLNRRIATMIGAKRGFLELPDAVGEMIAKLGFLPGAPITTDQWRMLRRDSIVTEGFDGLAAFGIEPTALDAVAPDWLVRYRRQGRFGAERRAP